MNDRFEEFKDRIEDAAIQAELETGEREESIEEAKSNALVRVARMTLGFIVVIIGIAALPLPGPGWLIIAGGLTILSKDVAWADRLLRYIRKRVPGIPEDGKIPRSSMVTIAFVTLAAVAASLWWTFGRGSDAIQAGDYQVSSLSGKTPAGMGIESVTITTDGPLVVGFRFEECGDLSFDVEVQTKETFELADSQPSVDPCERSEVRLLVDELAGATLTFGYGTDGLVEWFFADDHLETISVDGLSSLEIEVAQANE